jgi:hypothetical protein
MRLFLVAAVGVGVGVGVAAVCAFACVDMSLLPKKTNMCLYPFFVLVLLLLLFCLDSEPVPIKDSDVCWSNEPCFELSIPVNHTMLQAYNCDRQPPGKKTQSMPAEKQIYRADYVLQHFVHYSAVTELSEKNTSEYKKSGFRWKRRGFPDARQRFADEVTEGLMIHTKAVAQQDTAGWQRMCSIHNLYRSKRQQGLCRLGVPWPKDPELAKLNATAEGKGAAFNCFVNDKVEDFLVPRLNEQLAERLHFFDIK